MAIIGILDRSGNSSSTNSVNTYSGAQRSEIILIDISGGEATIDFDEGNYFETEPIESNVTFKNPINAIQGQSGLITVTQDAVGGHALAFESNWKFENGAVPSISTYPNSINILAYYIYDDDKIVLSLSSYNVE